MPSTYAPNEPSSQLFAEKTWLQGGTLSGVAYGVNLTLFILCFVTLGKKAIPLKSAPRQTLALLVYISVLFILNTLTMASQAEMTQLGFIDNRNYPGGPASYETAMFAIPMSNLGNVSFCITNWLSDGMLIWRCMVIYRGSRYPVWVFIMFPFVIFTTSFVTGVMFLVEIAKNKSSPWSTTFTLVYACVSLSLNVIMTLMISTRLYLHRRRVTRALGRGHGSQYTSVMAMLIESAAIFDAVVVFFIVPFALGSSLANIPLLILVQVQSNASFMIIFRVAQGKAWSTGTTNRLMTRDLEGLETTRHKEISKIKFSSNPGRIQASSQTDTDQFDIQEPINVQLEVKDVRVEFDETARTTGI